MVAADGDFHGSARSPFAGAGAAILWVPSAAIADSAVFPSSTLPGASRWRQHIPHRRRGRRPTGSARSSPAGASSRGGSAQSDGRCRQRLDVAAGHADEVIGLVQQFGGQCPGYGARSGRRRRSRAIHRLARRRPARDTPTAPPKSPGSRAAATPPGATETVAQAASCTAPRPAGCGRCYPVQTKTTRHAACRWIRSGASAPARSTRQSVPAMCRTAGPSGN